MDIDCISSVSFLFPENVYFCFVTLLKHESFVFFDIEPCTDSCNYIANRTGISLNPLYSDRFSHTFDAIRIKQPIVYFKGS